jgi:hypothetical protein
MYFIVSPLFDFNTVAKHTGTSKLREETLATHGPRDGQFASATGTMRGLEMA